ncbi:glycosyltransferase family 4 protein [Rhodococcus sp. IEGM 1341]|uniref:glycosyltransferase family 4 protein n=1 Tax=Rhodococcus sp. IEGM 1341 TaxID=3047090 RepID=UPI0024B65959|nr:glycosyltransferase family 4 protein [Rhodococcus sp. IEGM 1341]MDI9926234.1 glycosyltransferase family 4 protein [Rhodococcus sp. IEGM 1341]
MTKILMVVDAAPPHYGGAGQQALLLAKELEAEGSTVRIYARRRESTRSQSEMVRFVGPLIRSEALSNAIFAILIFFIVISSRADILHCHGAFYYGFSSTAAAKIRRIPIVLKVTLLGTDDPQSIRAQRKLGLNIGIILVRQFFWADRVVALNTDIQKACANFSSRIETVVVANGVKLNKSFREERELRARIPVVEPKVIFTGDVCIRKGVDTLLAAWRGFLNSYPDATLTLIGPVREEILRILGDLDPSTRNTIRVNGKLSHSSTLDALAASDVFILPSRSEGLPNSLIEAMGIGLSCVASSIPVNRTLCIDSATYCDPESVLSIEAALCNAVLKNDEMSTRALNRSESFGIGRTASAYVDIYNSLAKSPNSRKVLQR